jgi:methylenetetrahydrofolate reductase (NADPH)
MFFDTAVYHQFVKDCRAIGIACPILPGIMCITGAAGFFKMTAFCKTRVPESLRTTLTALQADEDSEDKIKEFGIQFGAEQCRQLLAGDEPPPVLHFYTLNLEKVVYGVLIELGLLSATAVAENAAAESVAAAVPGGNN